MKHVGMTVLLVSVVGPAVMAQSNIDPAQKFAWSENVGWTNWRDADAATRGVVVGDFVLAGFIWSENVGWINTGDGAPGDGVQYANLDGADFGVNIDTDGDLFGLAWGENVGWINFDTGSLGLDRAMFDACTHQFFGYAWGENVGWVNMADVTHFVAVGPCDLGDYDCNGNVALDDYDAFQSLLGGPGVPVECPAFDVDEDGDIDLLDFATVQDMFNGQ